MLPKENISCLCEEWCMMLLIPYPLYGKKCTIGKLGHSKEGKKDKPLIQVGLCVTQKEGVPVFHKTFDAKSLPTA